MTVRILVEFWEAFLAKLSNNAHHKQRLKGSTNVGPSFSVSPTIRWRDLLETPLIRIAVRGPATRGCPCRARSRVDPVFLREDSESNCCGALSEDK